MFHVEQLPVLFTCGMPMQIKFVTAIKIFSACLSHLSACGKNFMNFVPRGTIVQITYFLPGARDDLWEKFKNVPRGTSACGKE